MACRRVFFLAALVALSGCEPAAQAPVEVRKNEAAGPPVGPVEIAIAEAVAIRKWAADQIVLKRHEREFDEEAARVVLPVDPKHRKPALTRDWLAGYWVDQKLACSGSDSGLGLDADGTWSDSTESGTWRIVSDEIRTVVTEIFNAPDDAPVGERLSYKVVLLGPNEIGLSDWTDDKRRPLRLYRCPDGGMPAGT